MGDAFLELWQSEGLDASRVSRHPTAPTGVSFVTHGPAGHKFDYLREELGCLADDAGDLAGRLHRGRPLLPPVGHWPGDQRQRTARPATPPMRRFGRRAAGVKISYDTNLRLRLWDLDVGAGDHRRHSGSL